MNEIYFQGKKFLICSLDFEKTLIGGLVAGQTARIPGYWLNARYEWLDTSGKPLLPNWLLCSSAGLQEQSHLAGDESLEDPGSLVLAYKLVEESLQITQEVFNNHKHPDVRALISEKDLELYNMFKKSEKKASASKASAKAKAKAAAKKASLSEAAAGDLKRVQDELRCEKSTSEAFTALKPGVRGKSASQKGKLSGESQALAKAKAKTKIKPKTFASKFAKKLKGGTTPVEEPEHKPVEGPEHKPVEGPAHKPVEGNLLKKRVRFIDEESHLYGKEVDVRKHSDGRIHYLETGIGAGSVPETSVEDVSDVVQHQGWKNLGRLKTQDKYFILLDLGIWESPEHPDAELEQVFVANDSSTFIPDSAIVQGASLLQHCFPNDEAFIVDPVCSKSWWNCRTWEGDDQVPSHKAAEHLKENEVLQKRISDFLRHKFSDGKLQAIYFPIYCPQHWTLLVVEKEPSLRARYWDSLPTMKKGSFEMAKALVRDCLGLDIEVPTRHNYARQTEPTCGFFTLSFMEEDWRKRLKQGSASQGQSHMKNVNAWRQKLKTLGVVLKSERQKLLDEREKSKKKAGFKGLLKAFSMPLTGGPLNGL